MQTSGTSPQFSDGVKKQVTGAKPPSVGPKQPLTPKVTSHNPHRAGGHAKHQRSK